MESQVSIALTSFLLIFLAEFGDKSQIVCMTLASRYRSSAIAWGAIAAFAVLNLLAVTLGVLISRWVPETFITALVVALFFLFGIQAFRASQEDSDETGTEIDPRHLFISTFAMVFLAELGDKTQIAVAGLATQFPILTIWLSSTLALTLTTVMGVFAGKRWLSRLPTMWIHLLSGTVFMSLAFFGTLNLWELVRT